MKKLRLYHLYSKKFKYSKYIIILQYCMLFYMLFFMLPLLRNQIQGLKLVNEYPMNKMVYYTNVEPLRIGISNYENFNRLIENDKKFMKIVNSTDNISSVYPLYRQVHLVSMWGYDHGVEIQDKNSFSLLSNKQVKEDNNKIYAAVSKSKIMTDKYKIGQVYPFKLEYKGKMIDIEVEIFDYIDLNKPIIVKPDIIANFSVNLSAIIDVKRLEYDSTKIILMDSPKLSFIQNYDPEILEEFQRVVYFNQDTPQEKINEFVKKVNNQNIGYLQSNLDFEKEQKKTFIREMSLKMDRIVAFVLLIILSLISITKVSLSMIRAFHKLLHTLGYSRSKIYFLNFIYNLSLLLISIAIFNVFDSYINGGIVGKIFNPTSFWGPYYLTQFEKIIIFIFFFIVNLLLTSYTFISDKED